MSSLYASKTWLIKPHQTVYKIVFNYFVNYNCPLKSLEKIEGYFYAIFAAKTCQKL